MSTPTPSVIETIDEPEVLESIKLLPTEDDLPYDDGEPMETARHLDQMVLLIMSLRSHWSERKNYFAGGNMFLHFDPVSKRKFRGPDFFLVLDVENRERKSWVVWQEGMRFPDLIIELLSDSTRHVDEGEKKELYARLFHTPEYCTYDPFTYELRAYRLQGDSYRLEMPDSDGKVFSHVAHLYLVIKEGWLRWMTEDGVVVPSPEEMAEIAMKRAQEECRRAEEERQRADAEQRRADAEQRRADAERQRAEEECRRAEEERQRAEEECRRAVRAEQLLEEERQRAERLERELEEYKRDSIEPH